MASLQRIVLFDSFSGDELFSGRSMLSSQPPQPQFEVTSSSEEEIEIEPCPETLRSSVFVRVHDDLPASMDESGEIEVTFSEPQPELYSIREDENSEIRATPASLGRYSQPEISTEISEDEIDSLFEDDHAA